MFQNGKRDKVRSMSSGQAAPLEPSGDPLLGGDHAPAAAVSSKKLWRVMRAVYLVLVKKHQPKLDALGVHMHHLLSSKQQRGGDRRGLVAAAREHPALTYLSSLLCRSADSATAVVHPLPRPRRSSTSLGAAAAAAASLSCRSMDPAAAVCQYQYRPREVEFSCKSTPLHRRRREQRRLRLQPRAADQEYYGASAAAVTSLFELMDVKEMAEATLSDADYDIDLDDLETAVAWPALAVGSTPRQVRITDSPFPAREEDEEEGRGVVDRRADEFIVWFHEQLRAQQQRAASRERATYYWVR